MTVVRSRTLRVVRMAVLRAFVAALTILFGQWSALADESGLSFWLPGSFGSLAAAPGTPGWAFASTYYHTSVSSGSSVATAVTLPRFPAATVSFNIDATIRANADVMILTPSYTFASPVLGGQMAFALFGVFGRSQTTVDANVSGALGPIGFGASQSIGDTLVGLGDLLPQASLKWNHGLHNVMVYGRGGIPIGDYQASRIVNLGKGHGAIDGGVGYTYFDPASGHEFSAVTGLTYNFKNFDTDYQSGIDWHLDWAASQYLSKQIFIGAVGYFYNQLTDDSGAGAKLGGYRSRVAAIGPQFGYLFPVGDMQGFVNLKGYWEFAATNRPEGWNTWVVLSLSPLERR